MESLCGIFLGHSATQVYLTWIYIHYNMIFKLVCIRCLQRQTIFFFFFIAGFHTFCSLEYYNHFFFLSWDLIFQVMQIWFNLKKKKILIVSNKCHQRDSAFESIYLINLFFNGPINFRLPDSHESFRHLSSNLTYLKV